MARIVTFRNDKPPVNVIGTMTHEAWSDGARPPIEDPMVASERLWWRATGRLAYPEGATFSGSELPLLVSNAEHEANMRAGVADRDAAKAIHSSNGPPALEPLVPVETRLITSAPEVRSASFDEDEEPLEKIQDAWDRGEKGLTEPPRRGRPPRPRRPDGSIIRP